MKKQFPQKLLQTDRAEMFFHSNIPGQNYSAKNKIQLMERLKRVAGVKVVATADGGAPYSLDERCCRCFRGFFFFARSRSATKGLTRFIYTRMTEQRARGRQVERRKRKY